MSGFLASFLDKEVRNMAFKEEPFQITWDNLGNLEGKRTVLVAGRFREEKSREEIEKWVKDHGALSVLVMVAVGGKGDYSLFPEWGKISFCPGKTMRLDKFLKSSSLIKRRPLAQAACKGGGFW